MARLDCHQQPWVLRSLLFLLALVAQVVTLVVNCFSFKYLPTLHPAPRTLNLYRSLAAIGLATICICLTYLPWLPTLISHVSRPETDWLKLQESNWANVLAPLYQIPLGWILMVVALPVEQQPVWIAVLSGGFMLTFAVWLVWQVSGRFGQLWSTPEIHPATRMLVIFTLVVLLEFLGIIYLLGKDITLVPRYNFIYFPSVCALLGASLVQQGEGRGRRQEGRRKQGHGWIFSGRRVIVWVLLVGIISSVFVISNQVFLKPYQPALVAKDMRVEPEKPLFVGMGYADFQDVALGLSFALALQNQTLNQTSKRIDNQFAFLPRSQSYGQTLHALAEFRQPLNFPLNLWFIAPGWRRTDFPPHLALSKQVGKPDNCKIDPANYHRLGIPYQMYRCNSVNTGDK